MSKSKSSRKSGSPATKNLKRNQREQKVRVRARKHFLIFGLTFAGILLVGGIALFASLGNNRPMYDLTGIGQGIPAVVQVHDTTCPICTELRENIRLIERDFPDDVLLIRVADINTDAGLDFVQPHTPNRRVTLLYFDSTGKLVDTQVGLQSPTALRLAFQRHAKP